MAGCDAQPCLLSSSSLSHSISFTKRDEIPTKPTIYQNRASIHNYTLSIHLCTSKRSPPLPAFPTSELIRLLLFPLSFSEFPRKKNLFSSIFPELWPFTRGGRRGRIDREEEEEEESGRSLASVGGTRGVRRRKGWDPTINT